MSNNSSTAIAEGVFQGIQGCIYGAIWGLMTPFHVAGSPGAIAELKTGVFKPALPFSSIKSVGYNAAIFGSIMGIQRLSCKGLELARRREDYYNNIFGCAVAYKYYTFFLGSSERRLMMHNRTLGAGAIFVMIYGHFLA
mmetsp:Transcript_20134/g.24059  ORF Transcript_20134/g.24059 Transcript_20134/m.24059 type:complete len:139 (-) Transcript_20134:52-468(-)